MNIHKYDLSACDWLNFAIDIIYATSKTIWWRWLVIFICFIFIFLISCNHLPSHLIHLLKAAPLERVHDSWGFNYAAPQRSEHVVSAPHTNIKCVAVIYPASCYLW